MAWSGLAVSVWQGTAGYGEARCGSFGVARRPWYGLVRLGVVRRGEAAEAR